MTVLYILAAVLMFGVMITVHESGHFWAARVTGIPVREFAIGFGPALLQWKSRKHDTQFYLRAIPLGGYCAFYGEDDIKGEYSDDERSFSRFSVFKRMLTILMGPMMNFALAFLAAVILYVLIGVPHITGPTETQIKTVNQDSPAMAAGLMENDKIISLEGQTVTDNLQEILGKLCHDGARSLQIEVLRQNADGENIVKSQITPIYEPESARYMIGVSVLVTTPAEWKPGNAIEVLREASRYFSRAASSILDSLKQLVFRGKGAGEISGAVGIVKIIVNETRESKFPGYLSLMCLISVNLGLMNLLPIPGLDGSRALFLLIEGIRRKPIKNEAYVHLAGMILLFGLMIWITLRDIIRLF